MTQKYKSRNQKAVDELIAKTKDDSLRWKSKYESKEGQEYNTAYTAKWDRWTLRLDVMNSGPPDYDAQAVLWVAGPDSTTKGYQLAVCGTALELSAAVQAALLRAEDEGLKKAINVDGFLASVLGEAP